MLKFLPMLLFTQAQAVSGGCTEFNLWKGGDDGMTNRAFAQIESYNQGRQSCIEGKNCQKLDMAIQNVIPVDEKDDKAKIPVEIYRDIKDASTLVEKYVIECDISKNDCGEKIFGHKAAI